MISAVAILAKRFNTNIHVFLFISINLTTIFFAGAAIYRVSANIGNFMNWPLLKKGHVLGGNYNLI